MKLAADDREVRAEALRPQVVQKMRAAGDSRRAVAAEIGVSDMTLKRFLEGDTPYPQTLDLYEKWVGGVAVGATSDTSPEGDSDLARRLDQIEASDMPEVLKIMKIEAIAAAIRARQAETEARAAEIRARALERAEGSAESRARAIERAEEGARERAEALRGEGVEGRRAAPVVPAAPPDDKAKRRAAK